MASTWARVGKLLSVASLIWLGLTGLPTALGVLMAGGGWPERAYMEGMFGLWGFIVAPFLVFGMSGPLVRTGSRSWSTALGLIRLNLATSVPVACAYAAVFAWISDDATLWKDAVVVYALATVFAIVAVCAISRARRSREASGESSGVDPR